MYNLYPLIQQIQRNHYIVHGKHTNTIANNPNIPNSRRYYIHILDLSIFGHFHGQFLRAISCQSSYGIFTKSVEFTFFLVCDRLKMYDIGK